MLYHDVYSCYDNTKPIAMCLFFSITVNLIGNFKQFVNLCTDVRYQESALIFQTSFK